MLRRRALLLSLLIAFAAYPAKRARQAQKPAKPLVQTTRAKAGAVKLVPGERQWVQRWMRGMTVRDLAAQLIVITSYGEAPGSRTKQFREFVKAVRDLKVGGIIVVNRVVNGSVRSAEPYAMASFLNRMQKLTKVPLIAGADFERGASMRVANTIKYPHLMAYGAANDLALTRELGAATAREARALGIHWVFAPVADVNSNPNNPIINIRSFGEDPKLVSAHVQAFIAGAHSDPKHPVMTTAKHFPGHGDTNVDTHIGLATLTAGRKRMDEVELAPFRAAIAAGVDAVMTAHMAVPAIEQREVPATVSEALLTGLLRNDLGFPGLIVTDAMDMQGLTLQFPSGEASVRALEAGADILLMPPNPEEAIRAIAGAVKEGRLSRKRLEQSVTKLLAAKYRVGLHRTRLVDLDDVSDVLESEEAADAAQRAADGAVVLLRNEGSVLPVRDSKGACVYVLTESRGGQQGRRFAEELSRNVPGTRFATFDPLVSTTEIEDTIARLGACDVNVAAAFVSVAAYRGNVSLTGNYPALVEKLLAEKSPLALVSLGSPYLIRSFPGVDAYMTTFSPAPTAEAAAVKAIFGKIAVSGKLPVTIPGIAEFGDGMELSN